MGLQVQREDGTWTDVETFNPDMAGDLPTDMYGSVMVEKGDQGGADFTTHLKAGLVDDPATEAALYARDMGIPLERFGMYEGQMVYQGDDGKLYSVEPGAWGGFSKWVGEGVPGLLNGLISGAVGAATLNPVAAGGTAAMVEGGRQALGHYLFNEPYEPVSGAMKIATEGMGGAVGVGGGHAVKKGYEALNSKTGRVLMKDSGADLRHMDQGRIADNEALANKHGVRLAAPQLTENERLLGSYALLRRMPQTAEKLGAHEKQMQGDIRNAFRDLIAGKFGDADIDPYDAGNRLAEVSRGRLAMLKGKRDEAAGHLYQQAFNDDLYADSRMMTHVVKNLDGLIADTIPDGHPAQKKLREISKQLSQMIKKPLKNSGGYKVEKAGQDSLKKLHRSKVYMDSLIDGSHPHAADLGTLAEDSIMVRDLMSIRDGMLDAMETTSPAYQKARELFAQMSEPIEEAKKSVLGNLARMDGDNAVAASRRVFNSELASPKTVANLKAQIDEVDPEAWNMALSDFLRSQLTGIKGSVTGRPPNIAGHLWKSLAGTSDQIALMKAAMNPEQFAAFEEVTKLCQIAGRGMEGQSMTAIFQEMQENMNWSATGRALKLLEEPSIKRVFHIAGTHDLSEVHRNRYMNRIVDAMLDPQIAQRLADIRTMPEGAERLAKGLSVLGTIFGIDQTKQALQNNSDVPIGSYMDVYNPIGRQRDIKGR